MSENDVFERIGPQEGAPILCVADHASNRVPQDIALGIASEWLSDHIALDIGVEKIARLLAQNEGIPAHLARVSRLVCDLHREEDHPEVVPTQSDGVDIPGNRDADVEARLARFHRPYHEALGAWLDAIQPELILSLHSFTPRLRSAPGKRPWQIALLYNEDARAARIAIELLRDQGFCVGDNEPYSGRILNATMNRHAEAHGRPYLAIELRQDLIAHPQGQDEWAQIIATLARGVAKALGSRQV